MREWILKVICEFLQVFIFKGRFSERDENFEYDEF